MSETNLTGMSVASGAPLDGYAHLRQSILDILTTRRGERLMRPEYGSRLHELVDRPVNPGWLLDLYYECVTAIHRWEPRVHVARIRTTAITAGRVILELEATTATTRVEMRLDGLDIPL